MSLFPKTIFDLVYEDRTTGADEPENRSACPADEALIESVNRFGRADPAFLAGLSAEEAAMGVPVLWILTEGGAQPPWGVCVRL